MNIIGWTYEADVHCWECATRRFPKLRNDPDARLIDREGNEVRPIFEIDEGACDEVCGDCFEKLCEVW